MGWTWKQICADPVMHSIPYRVESDEWGNAVLTPMSDVDHSFRQSQIMFELARRLKGGKALVVFPLLTSKGVKALDVVWLSRKRRIQHPSVDDAFVMAPEICVEVIAKHNQRGEIEKRMKLYFQRGAAECWTCDVKGKMTFYDPAGPVAYSGICPEFPAGIKETKLKSTI